MSPCEDEACKKWEQARPKREKEFEKRRTECTTSRIERGKEKVYIYYILYIQTNQSIANITRIRLESFTRNLIYETPDIFFLRKS